MAVLVANMNTVALRHRTKQDTTMDVLRYMGLPDKQMARVQAYFTYITQYSHPASEGLSFLTDLPRSLFEELSGKTSRTGFGRAAHAPRERRLRVALAHRTFRRCFPG